MQHPKWIDEFFQLFVVQKNISAIENLMAPIFDLFFPNGSLQFWENVKRT